MFCHFRGLFPLASLFADDQTEKKIKLQQNYLEEHY